MMDGDQDFDQTQAIFLEDFDQETDEELDKDKQKPVAYLKVSCQKEFPEKTFPLFEGDNVIGRHEESCNICIPLKALSREHACIEIKGESHLIYDKGSRNKTKRNKLFLSPDVRYELKNGDQLIFGDVTCKYSIASMDEGSGIESESDNKTANAADRKDITVELEEEEYDSDNSIDLLQPTQAYTNHAHKSTVGRSLLADDSLVEKETTVLVGETPAPCRQKVTTGPVIEESGSETEDEDIVARNAPQTLLVEDSQKDESGEGDILYAQTQAYVAESDGADNTDNEEDHKTIYTEPTQAFTDVGINEKPEAEPTQTFVVESDPEEDDEEKKKSFQYAATQAYNAVDDFDEEEPTQTTEDEGEAVVETDEEDVSHLFISSTLACDVDDFPDEEGQQIVSASNQENETQVILEEPTQAIDGDDLSTQIFSGDEPTKVVRDDHEYATQVIEEVQKCHPAKKPVNFDDATVAVQEDGTVAVQEDATVAVQEDATVAVLEDATVAVLEDATVAVQEDATVAVQEDATVAVLEDATVAVNNDATVAVQEDATVAIQEDATVAVMDDATVAVLEDATVAINDDATLAVPEDAAVSAQDDATVAVKEEESDSKEFSGTKKGKGQGLRRPKKLENKASIALDRSKEPSNKKGRISTEDSDVTSSQESDDGNIRRSSRSKRKSFRIKEMEESMDDLIGIDESIRKGKDYSPERHESEESTSPRRDKRGRTRKSIEKEQVLTKATENDKVSEESMAAPPLQKNIPPLPKETVNQTEAEFLMTLPALQNKEIDAPVLTEATQAYTMEPIEELPKAEMVESTQPYCMMEEDSTPPLEEGGSGDKEEGDITPPIEDVLAATQPYSLAEEEIGDSEETKPKLISIPSRSPLKPALVSQEKREKKSPSPKRVQFTVKKIDSSSTDGSEKGGLTGTDVDKNDDKPATSRDSRSKSRRSKPSSELETVGDDIKPVKRGRRSVVQKDISTDKEEVKLEEKQPTKTRGRKSVNTEKSEEFVSKITKTRGRKTIESQDMDKKKIDGKEESEEETVALISDGESKDDVQSKTDTVSPVQRGRSKPTKTDTVSPVQRGRSKPTKTVTSSQETENSEKRDNVKITGDDAEKVDNSIKSSPKMVKVVGRRGRSVVHKIDESDQEIKEGSVNNARLKDLDKQGQENKTLKIDVNQDNKDTSKVGRKRKSTLYKHEEKVLDDKKESNEKILEILSTNEKDKEVENKTITKSKRQKDTEPPKPQSESKTVVSESDKISELNKSTTKQSVRRGRSSIVPETERRESNESEKDFKDTKPVAKKGKVSVVTNESSKQTEVDSKNKEGRGRRGRSVIVQNGNKLSEEESPVDDTESSKDRQRGHRLSSQPPVKSSEESKSVGRGRRGKSLIQTSGEDKEDASMPPPKSGVKGKNNTQIVEEKKSKAVNNRKQLRKAEINESVDSSKGGRKMKNEIDDQEISARNETDSSNRSRSSSRNRKRESEDISDLHVDSKPTRGKRKQDLCTDNIEHLPTTSKKTKSEKNLVESSDSESESNRVKSRGRSGIVKNRTASQEKENNSRSNSRTRSQQNESTKVAEPTPAHKRRMKETETSTGTPQKKAKLKEDQATPLTSKTLAVGSPSLRRKSVEPNKPKVLFTGVVDEHGQKIIKDLGGELVNSVFVCTHLVTDKIRRTVKFLCCLARGIPIVTLQWIESCKQSAMFVDCSKFQVKDTATEKQFKFTLHRSLEKAQEACLLQGYKVHVTKSVKPEPSQMKDIIECAGAEFLTSMPKKHSDNVVIISCPDDHSLCTAAIKAGVPVVNSEFILTGILRQEVEIKSYALFTEATENQTSSSGRRRR